jgi:TonB family protein
MKTALTPLTIVLFVSVAVAGCGTTRKPTLYPVSNPMPNVPSGYPVGNPMPIVPTGSQIETSGKHAVLRERTRTVAEALFQSRSKDHEGPNPISTPEPDYPKKLLSAGINGDVLIFYTVLADGTTTDVVILEATDIRFGEAVRKAVLKWKFAPAKFDGKPIACQLTQQMRFEVGR